VPRRATFAHPSLADLERQLGFAPPAAVRRRMEAAERLVDEIDPAVEYPLDFVTFRLTGFRPEGTGSPVAIAGELLREDLATLVLRASERLALRADEREGGAVPVLELARELGVDERSLRRWRGRGLLFHRVRLADGRSRVAVFRQTLARFRQREAERVARAGAFSRIDPATRGRIVERLRELVAAGETVNLAAKRIAGEFGRSHEAVRLVAARTLGGRGSRGRTPRDRVVCGRALRMGIPAALVAARLGLPEATVRRRADEWRAARLAGLRLAWIEYPTFARPEADETILAPAAARKDLAPTLAEEATAILARAAGEPAAPRGRGAAPAVEAMLAAFHFLVRRAARTVGALHPTGRRLDRTALDRAETDLRWAARLLRRLVERTLPAAVARLRQGLGRDPATLPADEIRALLSAVVARIVESVATVEIARGQSLSAKVQLAVDRLVATRGAGRAARAAARHPPGSLPMPGLFRSLVAWDAEALGAWLDALRLAGLDAKARRLLARRHGLDGGPPATLAELAFEAREPLGRLAGRLAEAERTARQRAAAQSTPS
jgi:RNA polymerase primary sigma factor